MGKQVDELEDKVKQLERNLDDIQSRLPKPDRKPLFAWLKDVSEDAPSCHREPDQNMCDME